MTDLDTLTMNTIRGLAMDAVQAANSGHPGTPMGKSLSAMRGEFGGHVEKPLAAGSEMVPATADPSAGEAAVPDAEEAPEPGAAP